MLFEDNVLTKEKKTSEKAKIEALIKASVKNNIKSNISQQTGNLRHPSCRRMTILLFQYKAGLGVEHGNHLPVYIQDNREDDWKPQAERIRMMVGAIQ